MLSRYQDNMIMQKKLEKEVVPLEKIPLSFHVMIWVSQFVSVTAMSRVF